MLFKLEATVYVEGNNAIDASMELHDILRDAVRNYPAFNNYHVDSCEEIENDTE